MTGISFLRDRLSSILIGFFCCIATASMLVVLRVAVDAVVLIVLVMVLGGALSLALSYGRCCRFYRELEQVVANLDKTYYVSELLDAPEFLEGRLTFEALEAVGRSAANDVARHAEQAKEYRDYIELWIHEIKTPIAAANLMSSNLYGAPAAKLRGELDRIEAQVDQALYYARSVSLDRDYVIREVSLAEIAHGACRKHARYLIERDCTPSFCIDDNMMVFADSAWLGFVVGQVVINAAKYGAHHLTFSASLENPRSAKEGSVLQITDDGQGIPAQDVGRVFDRGFTGSNGRAQGSATGMGLYLVALLCEKMGLGVALASEQGVGTRVMITFPHDRRALDCYQK